RGLSRRPRHRRHAPDHQLVRRRQLVGVLHGAAWGPRGRRGRHAGDDVRPALGSARHGDPVSYRLLYADVLTGELLGELPFVSVEASDVLNAPGSLRATAPLSFASTLKLTPQVQAPNPTDATLGPARTALHLERD